MGAPEGSSVGATAEAGRRGLSTGRARPPPECAAPRILELALTLHDGYGLEAATTQQDSATSWGSNIFGDLELLVVFLANIKSAFNPTRKERHSGTFAILLLLEGGEWLVPVVEASPLLALLRAMTTPLPFTMATLALGCLVQVLAVRPARPPPTNPG
jgi:hypothetical protein